MLEYKNGAYYVDGERYDSSPHILATILDILNDNAEEKAVRDLIEEIKKGNVNVYLISKVVNELRDVNKSRADLLLEVLNKSNSGIDQIKVLIDKLSKDNNDHTGKIIDATKGNTDRIVDALGNYQVNINSTIDSVSTVVGGKVVEENVRLKNALESTKKELERSIKEYEELAVKTKKNNDYLENLNKTLNSSIDSLKKELSLARLQISKLKDEVDTIEKEKKRYKPKQKKAVVCESFGDGSYIDNHGWYHPSQRCC